MSHHDKQQHSTKGHEIHLYKRRWAFLAALTLVQMLVGWSFAGFGQISNFYVRFFNVSYSQVDWMTIGNSVGPIAATVPFAWLTYKEILGLRNMAIFSATAATLGYLCLTLSTFDRSCFPVAVLGQIINSFMEQVMLAVPPIFAVLWFPEDQVGTAISISMMGSWLGAVLGLLVPTNSLDLEFANSTDYGERLARDNNTLRQLYACFTAAAFVVCVFIVSFVTDRPPNPPTVAQKLKTHGHEDKGIEAGNWDYDKENEKQKEKYKSKRTKYEIEYEKSTSLKTSHVVKDSFWSQTDHIMANKTFVLASVAFGIIYQAVVVEFTMMSQIVKSFAANRDVIGAYVMAMYCAGAGIGGIVSGKAVDLYKRYGVLSIIGANIAFLSSAGIVLAAYYESYRWLCLTNFVCGFGSQLAMVAALEIATQQTYPVDETFVSIWFVAFSFPAAIFYGEVGRVIFNAWGGLAVLSFQTVSLLFALSLCCLFDTVNKRLEIAKSHDHHSGKDVEAHEKNPLLGDEIGKSFARLFGN